MLLDQRQRLGEMPWRETVVPFNLDCRLKPELRFPLGVLHVHVCPWFLTREEVSRAARGRGPYGTSGNPMARVTQSINMCGEKGFCRKPASVPSANSRRASCSE